ncbi:hypothetical protein CR513_41701, partial [Mucuna pruriens]
MALSEYDIVYTSQKAIKGSALAKQLAHHPVSNYQPLRHEFPDEHIMIVGETESKSESDRWKLLGFDCTNNMAEYKACAMGIMMALEHQVKELKVFDDSLLAIYQLHGEWDT